MTIKTSINISDEQTLLIRLTALWALSEAGLGGIMHLFRSPFTGILVGGSAVLLIALIAFFSKKPAVAISKALIIVLIIKAMVSPHSPLPAYFAVGFQGLVGILLFSLIPSFRLAALLLGIFALIESALQKLLTLTILFGKSLWDALDTFIDHVLQKFNVLTEGVTAQGSYWLVGLYLGVYLVSGMLIGWLAGRLPNEIKLATQRLKPPKTASGLEVDQPSSIARKNFWQKRSFQWGFMIGLFLLVVYFLVPKSQTLLAPIWLLIRVVGIIVLWYFLVAPILMQILQGILRRKASDYQREVSAALDLFPVFRYLAKVAWYETASLRGWKRWKELAIRTITYALLYTKKDT